MTIEKEHKKYTAIMIALIIGIYIALICAAKCFGDEPKWVQDGEQRGKSEIVGRKLARGLDADKAKDAESLFRNHFKAMETGGGWEYQFRLNDIDSDIARLESEILAKQAELAEMKAARQWIEAELDIFADTLPTVTPSPTPSAIPTRGGDPNGR